MKNFKKQRTVKLILNLLISLLSKKKFNKQIQNNERNFTNDKNVSYQQGEQINVNEEEILNAILVLKNKKKKA